MCKKDPRKVREWNDRLMKAEQAFIDRDGLSGRPCSKHLVCFSLLKCGISELIEYSFVSNWFNPLKKKKIEDLPHHFCYSRLQLKCKCNKFNWYFAFPRFMRHQNTISMDLSPSLGLMMQLAKLQVLTQ